MNPIAHQALPVERLTREPGHYFFGYYDLQPWNRRGNYHLAHRVGFKDRMPSEHDTAELGVIRSYDDRFLPFAETAAWNFQQGTLLQWNPANPDEEVLYNARAGDGLRCILKNIETGTEKVIPRPIATVDPSGRRALSVNFGRIYDFRPGYGYAGIRDPQKAENQPEDDGVFLVDLDDGKERLVLSLRAMYEFVAEQTKSDALRDWKFLVNHITFNTDGSRFIALLRAYDRKSMKSGGLAQPRWNTFTITANPDGSDPFLLLDGVASHYHWMDAGRILIYANSWAEKKWGLYLFTDRTHESVRFDPRNQMPGDGHCSFSPDRKYMLNDTYPIDGYRDLFLYDVQGKEARRIASIPTIPNNLLASIDLRCDLHPRWNRDGTAISFDSVHEGHRHIYRMPMGRIDDLFSGTAG